MIRFDNVTKIYKGAAVIENMSFELPDTGFVAVKGDSGSGKTTLLRLIAGLIKPDGGTVIRDTDLISMVFQENRLLPWSTALSNAAIASDETKAKELLFELGIGDAADKYPSELSGGMQRRVAIARALAVDADIYIMDEPIKGLDEQTGKKTLELIKSVREKALLIMVSHDGNELKDADITLETKGRTRT